MAKKALKKKEETTPQTKGWTMTDLSEQQQKDYTFVQERIQSIQRARRNHYGTDVEKIWTDADRDYIPHRLNTKTVRAVATDEDKGWRGSLVTLGSSDWQSDVSQSNPYIKIQTALSILVDQNPSGVFTPTAKQYQATTELIKQLYDRSWDFAKSKAQLKLFIFNLAKYGWAVGRTFPLRLTRRVKVMNEYNAEDPEKSTYTEKDVVEYDDIMRENLDPRNVWIDDMARPNNARSVRDWCFRKVYDIDTFKEEFKNYGAVKNGWVKAGGNTMETVGATTAQSQKNPEGKNLIEVYFYESIAKDLFMVIAGGINGVPVCMEPLPVSDQKGAKKLSLWQTYWNLRHAESCYGIGIYEAIRFDQGMLDRLRNMTIDQITMSIYKMFFYQGTSSLMETGDIKIQPGVGKQVLDPKAVTWLEIPGPGKDGYAGIEMFSKDVDEASGISETLEGTITGKTAFEIAQAKESALKRLKNPVDNILETLNDEGYITIALMQMLYTIPEVYDITDEGLIAAYISEIKGDPDLFERGNDSEPDETGAVTPGAFKAKIYREFPLNLSKDEKGNLTQTNDTQFFRVKPGALDWEGIVNIKAQSILSPSKQVDKALDLEMYNLLIPLIQNAAALGQSGVDLFSKIATSIVKLYDKDPKDILPDSWLAPAQATQPEAPQLFTQGGTPATPATQTGAPAPQGPLMPTGADTAQKLISSPGTPARSLGSSFAQ